MKTEAAILWETGGTWSVEESELDPPHAGAVLVERVASGLGHAADHAVVVVGRDIQQPVARQIKDVAEGTHPGVAIAHGNGVDRRGRRAVGFGKTHQAIADDALVFH